MLQVAQLIVRNLDDELVRRLKQRAVEHGCSTEEEHRQILRRNLLSEDLMGRLLAIPEVGDDPDFERDRDEQRVIDL